MWSAIKDLAARLWDAYMAFIEPLFIWIQWGVAIGGAMLLLGWGARKIARMMTECPSCGRVIPKSWNPCKMCGYTFGAPDTPGGPEAPPPPAAGATGA